MGIKLGDISPLAGAISGKGLFGKGMASLADSGMGMLLPMSYLAKSARDKDEKKKKKANGTEVEVEVEAEGEGAPTMRKGGKVKKMAKGGSTASKRGDGCATKGKTKGRFV